MSSETTVHCLQRLPRGICAATGSCPLLFVSGDRSSVGKSSICLGLLASFMEQGIRPEKLAYIKPVTQCEAEQPVTRFCAQHGIQCVGLGPVVFYKGFTREFLAGNVGTSAELLEDAAAAVQQVARGKHLVLVDGVGYPAVGSICGISNADVAARLNAPVLLVGKPGVGDAVDSFNLNASFFESRNVRVLGVVYNKFEVDGYYSLDKCEPAIRSYFDQYRRQTRVYGFLPKMEVQAPDDASDADRDALFRSQFTRLFVDIFDIDRLAVDMLHDVCMKRLATVCAGAGIQRTLQQTVPMTLAATQTPVESNTTAVATAAAAATTAAAAASPSFPSSSSVSATDAAAAAAASVAVAQRIPRRKATVSSTANGASPVAPPNKRRRTRADIEAVARAQGARAGG